MVNAYIDIFPIAPIHSNQKVTIVPGERLVRCTYCSRRMKPTSCRTAFEALLEFENIKLTLPINVLETFFQEDIMSKYGNDADSLMKILLYLEDVDYENSPHKKIISKMDMRYY